jgi:hypothetical protein
MLFVGGLTEVDVADCPLEPGVLDAGEMAATSVDVGGVEDVVVAVEAPELPHAATTSDSDPARIATRERTPFDLTCSPSRVSRRPTPAT